MPAEEYDSDDEFNGAPVYEDEEDDEDDEDDFSDSEDEDDFAALDAFDEDDDDDDDDEDDDDEDDAPRRTKKGGVVIEELAQQEDETHTKKKPEKKKEEKKRAADPPPEPPAKKEKKTAATEKKSAPSSETEKPKKPEPEREPEPKGSLRREFKNGMEITNLSMGRPDGKQAKPGKNVTMKYVGKLQSGKIFDQTKGNATFRFRLGVGEVIKGWDAGVDGMRVGDKRRLVIPPAMAYGKKGIKGAIPGGATLVFEVELVNVQ